MRQVASQRGKLDEWSYLLAVVSAILVICPQKASLEKRNAVKAGSKFCNAVQLSLFVHGVRACGVE